MTGMRRAAAVTAVAVLLLAGCQDDGDEPSATPTGTSTPTPTSTGPTDDDGTEAPGTTEATGTGDDATGTGTDGTTDDDPDPTQTSDEALPPWTDDPQEQAPVASDEPQEITDVRTGLHEDFDRVVLDLTGDEPHLGWFAGFVDEAVEDPTGEPLAVKGDAFLQLGIYGIDWTTPSTDRYSGASVDGGSLEVVEEVVFGGLFEAQQQILIGLDERTAYRMFALSDPARIVIDIRHG